MRCKPSALRCWPAAPTLARPLVADYVDRLTVDAGSPPDRARAQALVQRLPPLWLDRARLQWMLRNLPDNALRHGGGTPVLLRTAAGAHAKASAWTLSVRGHGPGVDGAALQRLGVAYSRPDVARTRRTGGGGLGLHLCRQVALSHGGTRVLRAAAPGLEVSLRLPAQAAVRPA